MFPFAAEILVLLREIAAELPRLREAVEDHARAIQEHGGSVAMRGDLRALHPLRLDHLPDYDPAFVGPVEGEGGALLHPGAIEA